MSCPLEGATGLLYGRKATQAASIYSQPDHQMPMAHGLVVGRIRPDRQRFYMQLSQRLAVEAGWCRSVPSGSRHTQRQPVAGIGPIWVLVTTHSASQMYGDNQVTIYSSR